MNVYCIIFPNGKRYFGIEKRTGQRLAQHVALCERVQRGGKSVQAVHYAMAKYGLENIKFQYFVRDVSDEEAKFLEIHYIGEFRTQEKAFGYNRTSGGDGCPDLSEESIESMRKNLREMNARLTPEERKHRTSAAHQAIREKGFSKETVARIQAGRAAMSPEAKAARNLKLSENSKKRWADPAFKEKMRVAMEDIDPEIKQKMREASSRAHKGKRNAPHVIKAMLEGVARISGDKRISMLKKRSESLKKFWETADEDYKNNRLKGVRERITSPESRERYRQAAIRREALKKLTPK